MASAIAVMVAAPGCAIFQGQDDPVAFDASGVIASQRALEYLPDMESLYWTEPDAQRDSRVTVLETLAAGEGQFCRLLFVEVSAYPDGVIERYCREADTGVWRFDGRDIEASVTRVFTEDHPLASR